MLVNFLNELRVKKYNEKTIRRRLWVFIRIRIDG